VNLGDARAADVLALVELAQDRVRAMMGIELELEIKVVGED
jgi:UDP-N-acetylenolpyruvoylglucosamine reductase